MITISELQAHIVDPSVSLTSILREAQIIAYELESSEFKEWIDSELNGYRNWNSLDELKHVLPSYRITQGEILCDLTDGFRAVSNLPFQQELFDDFRSMFFIEAAPTLEKILSDTSESDKVMQQSLRPFEVKIINQIYENTGYVCLRAWRQCSKFFVAHIVESVRNRLLSFTLELKKLYPQLDHKPTTSQIQISPEKVSQVFHITILEGGTMSVFDQKNQKVSGNQYNAAGNITFGNVASKNDYVSELLKLQDFVKVAISQNEIGEEASPDAEYHIKKAVQKAKSPDANGEEIRSHLNQLKNIAAGVVSLAGMVTAIGKAIEVLPSIFPSATP